MNHEAVVTNTINRKVIEHIAIVNVTVNATRGDWCPLIGFVHAPGRMYHKLQTLRLKGDIKGTSIMSLFMGLLFGSFPSLHYVSLHSVLPAGHI